MHKAIPLTSIDPNPFRHMDRYPINDDKIADLIGSMNRTGYWDNVVARKQNGRYQLAYGHHRWIAFKKKYGKNAEMTLIVRDLSDEDMLRVMADENMQEFESNAMIEQETIRAVVLAYAEGKITLPKPKDTSSHNVKGWRLAPQFRVVSTKDFDFLDKKIKPYNAESIARFLGWMKGGSDGDQVRPCVRNALAVLEAAEEAAAVLDDPEAAEEFEELTKGLGSDQARRTVKAYETIKKAHEGAGDSPKRAARKALGETKKLAQELRDGEGIRGTEEKIARLRRKVERGMDRVPLVTEFCRELSKDLYGLLGEKDTRWDKLNEIVNHREHIHEDDKNEVIVSLKMVSERCIAMIDAINGDRIKLLP